MRRVSVEEKISYDLIETMVMEGLGYPSAQTTAVQQKISAQLIDRLWIDFPNILMIRIAKKDVQALLPLKPDDEHRARSDKDKIRYYSELVEAQKFNYIIIDPAKIRHINQISAKIGVATRNLGRNLQEQGKKYGGKDKIPLQVKSKIKADILGALKMGEAEFHKWFQKIEVIREFPSEIMLGIVTQAGKDTPESAKLRGVLEGFMNRYKQVATPRKPYQETVTITVESPKPPETTNPSSIIPDSPNSGAATTTIGSLGSPASVMSQSDLISLLKIMQDQAFKTVPVVGLKRAATVASGLNQQGREETRRTAGAQSLYRHPTSPISSR